jgi:hypothetical protein
MCVRDPKLMWGESAPTRINARDHKLPEAVCAVKTASPV